MKTICTTILFVSIFISISAQSTLYITSVGAGTKAGNNWANAGDSSMVQSFINSAGVNSQIWLAKGIYFPTAFPGGCSGCTNSRDNTFTVKNKVSLYGGFSGSETSLSQRNTSQNGTILSGDIGVSGSNADNTYHVITAINIDSTTVVDGFTVKDGNGNVFNNTTVNGTPVSRGSGGGLIAINSGAVIQNCDFISNQAIQGGGLYTESGSLKVSFCNFSVNKSLANGQGGGAGMYNSASAAKIYNCVFTNNAAQNGGGGGMLNSNSFPLLRNCVFAFNSLDTINAGMATAAGGAMHNSYSDATLINCVFYRNSSKGGAGAMNNSHSSPVITHCTFTADTSNIAWELDNNGFSQPVVSNTIIYGVGGNVIGHDGSSSGNGSTLANPLFVNRLNAIGNDNKWGTADDGLRLSCNSPLRNIGDNLNTDSFDITGTNRYEYLPVDMGAYENTFIDSQLFVTVLATPNPVCTGDTVTFTALPTDSNSYHYSWSHYGFPVSSAGPYYSRSFTADDTTVRCTISASCNTHQATSDRILVAVSSFVSSAVTITSPDTLPVCAGTPVLFNANPVNGGSSPSYIWVVNGIQFPSDSGTYTGYFNPDTAIVSCLMISGLQCVNEDTVSSNDIAIVVKPTPPAPVITQAGNTLTSSDTTGNQWYFNDSIINGAIAQNYTPSQNASYHVIVSADNGCESLPSNTIQFVFNGISNLTNGPVRVFPNPATSEIEFVIDGKQLEQLFVYNANGKRMQCQKMLQGNRIDVSQFPSGVYLIEFKINGVTERAKWVKI